MSKIQSKLQKFGGFLSGMIIPVIGIIIAWSLLTAFVIKSGFMPNAILQKVVGPTINVLIPILVAYQAGKMLYGTRGGMLGAFVALGPIHGAEYWLKQTSMFPGITSQNMLLGAMISAPIAVWVFKKIESFWKDKIKPGYEMLVDNFSLAIFGVLAISVAIYTITPMVLYISLYIGKAAAFLQTNGLTWLLSIIVEPAKPFFLNNAIGNGTLVPIGINEVAQNGKSLLFFIEANPGPGFGMILAFIMFGFKREKAQSAAAAPIHFLGGIHEVYFPFVLANLAIIPILILAGIAGVVTMMAFNAGLVAPMSPGSIIAAIISTNKTKLDYAGMFSAVAISTIVSFIGTTIYLKSRKSAGDLDDAALTMNKLKGKKSKYVKTKKVKLVNIACDQGAGSSALAKTTLNRLFKKHKITEVKIINTAIKAISEDADVVITMKAFEKTAKTYMKKGKYFSVSNFLSESDFHEILEYIKMNS